MAEPNAADNIIGQTSLAFPVRKNDQGLLFPRRALTEASKKENSADALGEVDACDGLRYFVKGDGNGCPTRASEWICAAIAEAVGIGTPATAVVERQNGELVFGSRSLGGVADKLVTQTYLTTHSSDSQLNAVLVALLSKIYAFDMFINNEDRHLGNYLSNEDGGKRRLYAFDFSRALFWRWPWSGFPAPDQNTRRCGFILRSIHGFDMQGAEEILAKLSGISETTIRGSLERMPSEWLSLKLRSDFIRMWSGIERHARIDALRKGLGDGTLL
jgi:hypothetical protein